METQTGMAPASFEARLRTVTIVHWGMLASGVLLILIAEMLGSKIAQGGADEVMMLVFGFIAAMNAAVAFFVQRKWVAGSEDSLRISPEDAATVQRWVQGSIVTAALCESVIMLGFVMRMIGAASVAVWPFYAGGLLLMLLFVPRRP